MTQTRHPQPTSTADTDPLDPHSPAYAGPCARCQGGVPNDKEPGEHPGVLSRTDDLTYLCYYCGVDEAIWGHMYRNEPMPPLDQPLFG